MKPETIAAKVTLAALAAGIFAPLPPVSLRANALDNATPSTSETASDSAEVQLARYLSDRGVQMFGAFWCPHCQHQRDRFGEEAFQEIDYIECDPQGENSRPQLCRDEQIQGYPTWKINGQLYPGDRSLEELADLSGYPGSRNFTTDNEP